MTRTQRQIRLFYKRKFKRTLGKTLAKFIICLLIALIVAFVPTYDGLSYSGVMALFILIFAAGLWVSEAIPAFAVSLLVMGLNIVLIAYEGFNFTLSDVKWQIYIAPWANSLIFLFFAGFIIGEAANKTKLDLWFAKEVLFLVGDKPKNILIAVLFISFFFSMFMSNTATAVMMTTIITPIIATMNKADKFAKALLLAVCVGSNIGGMGTIIGTPPNAIAVGILGSNAPDFLMWMVYATPPAVVIAVILLFYILKFYPSMQDKIDIKKIAHIKHYDDSTTEFTKIPTVPSWKKIVVILTLILTILLWLTSSFHGIPTTVVAFLPIVVFTTFDILNSDDICRLRWDIIILIAGGLSLGVAVSQSGLAAWFSELFDVRHLGIVGFALIFSYIVVIISNFMSNTGAANVVLPLVVAFATAFSSSQINMAVICVALSASFAMTLPVSTPPNAVVYSVGRLEIKDLVRLGIITGIFAPLVTFAWVYFVIH